MINTIYLLDLYLKIKVKILDFIIVLKQIKDAWLTNYI